jgi:DNA or RNA helicases of superfamily II
MITLHKMNESYARMEYDEDKELSLIHNALSYYPDNYRFMPAFKNGMWDGQIHLMDASTGAFPLGLVRHVLKTAKELGLEYKVDSEVARCFVDMNFSKVDFESFLETTRFFSGGVEIFPRDDQIEATQRALESRRCINLCPTSFGKSLSITIECLYLIRQGKTCIIVVPTKDLVDQFANDIKDYATNEEGKLEPWYPKIQMIYGGKDKDLKDDTQICISTWQSLYSIWKGNRKYMNQFDCICLDECHRSASRALQSVMMSAKDVGIRTGWTGTLANEQINEMLIRGLFGEARQIITTLELMDRKIVAQLKISIIKLQYPEGWGRKFKLLDYQNQCKYFEELQERTDSICRMALDRNTTGLMLYKKIAHGETIFNTLRKMAPERNIYLVHSGHFQRNDEKFKSFEELKPLLEQEKNAVLVANYQLVGTGVSIKNLHFVMFAAPIKSYITTIQSIGRGLRVSDTKKAVELIDIVDDMSYKARVNIVQNYALKHYAERYRIYTMNGFDYSMDVVHIEPSEMTF